MGSLGSYVICLMSLVIGHLLMGEMFVVTTSVVSFVRSNDFSRCLVTWRQPSNTLISDLNSCSQAGARPSDCSCYGVSHNTRATTEVVTTNFFPIFGI
jgi:hypothetical protein